ncbi:MAG: hypothetical protein IPH77_10520 [Ignavibacteria bacterium]|nr:hypothetical protein [Ignavibacteria bacterium]
MKSISLKFIFILSVYLNLFSLNICMSQIVQNSTLKFTLEARGLTENDITIPLNFDKDKSPTNDAKLILPEVKYLMKSPLGSFGFMDSVSDLSNKDFMNILKDCLFLEIFILISKELLNLSQAENPDNSQTSL